MAAYVIGEAEILHPERMAGYGPAVARAVALYGGKYLARGALAEVLEGGSAHRFLIIEFQDIATAKRWFASPEYNEAKKLREGNTRLRLVLVESFQEIAT